MSKVVDILYLHVFKRVAELHIRSGVSNDLFRYMKLTGLVKCQTFSGSIIYALL